MRTLCVACALVAVVSCSQRSFDSYLTSGRQYLTSKQYAEAAIQLENAARIDPRSAAVQSDLGEVYEALDQPANAAAAYEQACRLDERDAATCIRAASLLLAMGQYESVIQATRAVLTVDKFNLDAQLMLASALTRTRRFADAEERIAAALALAPQDPRAYQALAEVQLQRGRNKAAEASLRRAIELEPPGSGATRSSARVALAEMLFENGRSSDGEREIKAALAANPSDASANRMYASYLVGTDRCDDAESYWKAAAEQSNEVTDWLSLADYYVWSKRSDEALNVLNRVSGRDTSGEVKARIASILYDRGDRKSAGGVVDALVEGNPSNVSGLLLQARMALDAGDASRARELAHRAEAIAPSSPAVREMLAAIAEASSSR